MKAGVAPLHGASRHRRVETWRSTLDLGTATTALIVRRNPAARRISLRIPPSGEGVVVVVPAGARAEDAMAAARAHTDWIRERLAALPARVPFVDGALLPVHGRLLRIRHEPSGRPRVRLESDELRIGGPGDPSPRVLAWLRAEAKRVIASSVVEPARRIGRSPGKITVRDTRSRWGSCTSSGDLSFSWRLLLAPPEVLGYVVAHEVAHLRHRGHGPDFWRTVHELAGDPVPARRWLRWHGQELFRWG